MYRAVLNVIKQITGKMERPLRRDNQFESNCIENTNTRSINIDFERLVDINQIRVCIFLCIYAVLFIRSFADL